MSDYYQQTVVHQPIPHDCMAPLERWLMDRIFEHEPDGENCEYYFASECPATEVEFDESFEVAREQSQSLCAELCAEVAHHADGSLVDLNAVHFSTVLQSIVKRNRDRLPYVTAESGFTCSKMRPDGFGGASWLITPDEIAFQSTGEWLEAELEERGLAEAAPATTAMPTPTATNRVKKVCAKCGSEDVLADAYVEWDSEAQQWAVQNVMDKGHHCNACDEECDIEEVAA